MDIRSNSLKNTITWTATSLARAQQLFNEESQAEAYERVRILEAFLTDALKATRSIRADMEAVGAQQAVEVEKMQAEFMAALENLPVYDGDVAGEAA